MKRIAVTALILIWWLGSLWFFSRSEAGTVMVASDVPIVAVGNIAGESYRSVYFRGEKIGYSASIKQVVGTGFIWQENSYLRLPVGGVIQEVLAELNVVTDSSMVVRNFSFNFSAEDYESSISGTVSDNVLSLVIRTDESQSRRRIPLSQPIYMPSAITYFAAADSFRQDQYSLPVFDPMSLTMRTYTVVVLKKTNSPRGDPNVWHIHSTYNEFSTESWVDAEGNIVMERSGTGFISYQEPREKALQFNLARSGSFDLLMEFRARMMNKSDKRIDKPKVMKAKISGIDPTIFDLEDFNQAFDGENCIITVYDEGFAIDTDQNDTAKITVVSVDGIDGYFVPPEVTPEDTMQTPLIQKNDLRIYRMANRITEKANTDKEKLEAINQWLYDNIEKDNRASIPSAVDILRQRVGDCNEHTTLFTALARSLGIPTRMIIGLVHLDGAFYYHAWPQSYADGKWHAFDPTHGESPAGAARIKLLHGDISKQIEILRIERPFITVIEIDEDYDFESYEVSEISLEELMKYPCYTGQVLDDIVELEGVMSD